MMHSMRMPAVLLGAALFSACSGDAKTEGRVTTTTSDGTVATSMSGEAADERGVALVRVANATANIDNMQIRGDNGQLLPAVKYKTVSDYQRIDKSWNRFEVSGTQGGAYLPVETNREMLTDGHRYTMVVMREEDNAELKTRILRDDISADTTKSHLRVIHAARGTDEISVVAQGGETILKGVNYGSEAGFTDVTPWSGTLEIRTANDNRRLLTLPNFALQAGSSYTIVLSRKGAGALESFWFSDAQRPAVQY